MKFGLAVLGAFALIWFMLTFVLTPVVLIAFACGGVTGYGLKRSVSRRQLPPG